MTWTRVPVCRHSSRGLTVADNGNRTPLMATQTNTRTRRIECIRIPNPHLDLYSVALLMPAKPLAVIHAGGVFLMLELDVTDELRQEEGKILPMACTVMVRRVKHGDTFRIGSEFEFLNVADGCAYYAKTVQVQP